MDWKTRQRKAVMAYSFLWKIIYSLQTHKFKCHNSEQMCAYTQTSNNVEDLEYLGVIMIKDGTVGE